MFKCSRCGYEWTSRSEAPTRCPKCLTTKWSDKKIVGVCQRCGRVWVRRSEARPKYCPGCHSPAWDRKRVLYACPKCGVTHEVKSKARSSLCPACDRYETRKKPPMRRYDSRPPSGIGDVMKIWSDGNGLTLSMVEGGKLTLSVGGRPAATEDLAHWCVENGVTVPVASGGAHDDAMDGMLRNLAMSMYARRGDYEGRARELVETCKMTYGEAACIALHDEGLTPLQISMRLDLPFSEVMLVL